jgi:hypothetical protein
VLFGLHPSESPCEEEHMHSGSHVEVPIYICTVEVLNSKSKSYSNSSLLECSPETQATRV